MSFRSLLIASALLAAASAVDQSTCNLIWFFPLPCTEPVSGLVSQVKAWSTKECHGSQEECMYEIIKESSTYLEVRHTSLSTHKTTEMAFEFTPPAGPPFCKVRARSTTMSQNANRPNEYCLLYDLIHGSGLEDYNEISNEAMCPSKKSATCNNEE
ncbi:hypothetical protein VZT92_003782 [Zoarces viviparus]|uniref:Uncharacterized protein n=1 Tax=Zoarces viviparus TaxID=48416 RepID=A0AAW1FWJ1_ZOAVI